MIYQRFRRRSKYTSFEDLVQYVTTRENAINSETRIPDEDIALRHLGGLDSAVDDMDAVATRRHGRCNDPTFHATISWASGETPTREEMFLAADELMREFGMEESQAIYSIHRDTDNLHIHIAASRISTRDYKAADLQGDYLRGERLMRELELRFGREFTIGKHYTIEAGRVVRIKPDYYDMSDISADAQKREVRRGKLSFQSVVMGEPRDAIEKLLDDPRTGWAELNAMLKRYDLQYRLYRDRSGKVVGGQIVDVADPEHKHISASKIDRRLSYKHLIKDKRFGAIPDVDAVRMRFSTSKFERFDEYVAHVMGSMRKAADATKNWEQFGEVLARAGLRYSWATGKGARIHDIDDDARLVPPTALGEKAFRWLRYTELKARFGDFRAPGRGFNRPDKSSRADAPQRAARGAAAAHASSGSVHVENAGERRDRDVDPESTWSARAEEAAFVNELHARSKRIALDPSEVLDELTRHDSIFTEKQLKDALAEAATVNGKVNKDDLTGAFRTVADHLFIIPGEGEKRFTSVAMREQERELDRHMAALAHESATPLYVDPRHLEGLDKDQRNFVLQAASGARLTFARGAAGAGKSFALGRVKAVFEDNGWEVIGCSLASVAAERLQADSGIESTSNAALLYRIGIDPDTLGPNTLVVMDEANLTGIRQANAIYGAVRERGARVTGAGDEGQLPSVEAGDAFGRYTELFPDRVAELSTPRRQTSSRDLAATAAFFQKRYRAGVEIHLNGGSFTRCANDDHLQDRIMAAWDATTRAEPDALVWVQSSRNWVVDQLNERAHEIRHRRGELSGDTNVRITLRRNDKTIKDTRRFAVGERIRFGKNEDLRENETGAKVKVKNGTLGTVEEMEIKGKRATSLLVRLDSGAVVKFSLDSYSWVDYGYAGTDYKGEGLTAKHTLWAVGKYDDGLKANVALTRHTHTVRAYYSALDFPDEAALIDKLGIPKYKRSSLQHYDENHDVFERRTQTIQTPAPAAPTDAPIDDIFAKTMQRRRITPISREEFASGKYERKPGRLVDKLVAGDRVHLLLEYDARRSAQVTVPNTLAVRELQFGALLTSDGKTLSRYEQPGSAKGPRIDLGTFKL